MKFKDYYQTFGVSRDAPQDEIKRVYRKLARKFHPDVNKDPDAELKFKELSEAYEVLKDPEKRAAYDKFGSNWQQGQDFHPPPDWDAGFEFSGADFSGAEQADFSDFFSQLFGSRQFNRSGRTAFFRSKGEDNHAKIIISLEEAWHGAGKTFILTRPDVNERGELVNRKHTINVNIPKGVSEGQKIRLQGQGMAGRGGGGNGDLYLEISFEKHPLFTTDKRDIHLTLPVTPWEAALGATVEAPTLGGKVKLNIPPGSQSDGKLRLKGRGLCTSGHSGDQIVTLKIVIPAAKTKKEKEIYRKMAEIMPLNPRQAMEGR
ncbi:MAG: DnaJ C-terminal domain-containing protein [Thermodesulfobacteriota bacterium]|nr:DnaJ C-terminal domain-containing protein [Thermodesulfobacteriota bacterium]